MLCVWRGSGGHIYEESAFMITKKNVVTTGEQKKKIVIAFKGKKMAQEKKI